MLLICIGLALFLIIAFYIFDNDFFSTSFLVLAGYFVSSLFAMYSSEKWGTDIHWILIVILFSGWSAFVFGEIFIKRILYKNHWHNNELAEFQEITFQPIVLILLIGLNIIITLFLYAVANKIPSLYSTAYGIFNLAWTETASKVSDDGNPAEYYTKLFSGLFKFLI